MPDIKSLVKKMLDDGESEDVIKAVIRKMDAEDGSDIKSGLPDMSPELPAPRPKDTYTGPTTFAGGVQKSLFGGEAIKAGLEGLGGFARGAIADIPSTVVEGVKGLAAGAESLWKDPAAHMRAMGPAFSEMGHGMKETFENAGADPHAFGRMMGQMTGQPLVTEGALGAIPRLRMPVANTMSRVGNSMAEHQPISGVVPPIMLPRAARLTEAAVGRGLKRGGEKLRLKASGVETAGDAASRSRPNRPPPPGGTPAGQADIIPPIFETAEQMAARGPGRRRPSAFLDDTVPSEADPMFQPELETAADLAARGPEPRPSLFSDDVVPSEADPMFRSEVEPPPGARLNRNKVPTPEEEMTAALREVQEDLAKAGDPSVELPPAPYSQGAPAAPEQPRFSVKATKSNAPVKDKPATAPKKPNTPAGTPPPANPSAFTSEDIALLRSRRAELKAALEKMAANSENVDINTGEILETPQGGNGWRISEPSEEMGFFGDENPPSIANDEGRMFASEVEDYAPTRTFPGDEAIDLGDLGAEPIALNSLFDRPTQSMPDWGPDVLNTPVKAPPTGVNPLRPQVPSGQVTNRQMFELSERRALENRIAQQKQRETAPPINHEFDMDMAMLPEEMIQADIPPMRSDVPNQYDPRTSNIDMAHPKPSFWQHTKDLFADETGAVGPNIRRDAKPRLVKQPKEKNFPSVIPDGFGKVGGKPVGPKGASYRVTAPDGKHLGDINITPAEIAEMKAHEGGMLAHVDDGDLAELMYQERLGEMLEKHGYSADEPKVKAEPKTTRTKDVPLTPRDKPMPSTPTGDIPVGSEGMESLTDYSGTGREPRFPGDTPKGTGKSAFNIKREIIDPDKDFGPGGNIGPIAKEAARLSADNAVDSKFRSLLPKEMRAELGPGETYKGKLQRLLETIQEEERMSPEAGAQRLAELDAFNNSMRGYENPVGPELPPLDPRAIDVSKLRKGKLNQQPSPWASPRMQQQHPDLYRRIMGLAPKKKK